MAAEAAGAALAAAAPAAGFAPGEDFTGALAYAHGLKLSGVEKEDALRQTIAYLRRARGV